MKLSKLLESIENSKFNKDCEITDIVFDSRKADAGTMFVCIRGSASDGHDYAAKAAENGAAVIIAEEDINCSAQVIVVDNTKIALALLSAKFFGNPANKDIKVIGITGTAGKTTTAYMMKSILESAGHKTGVIGTVGVLIGERLIKINNTTPSSYEVQKYLREMADNGCKYCVMEASSIGLRDLRVYGFEFAAGVFTNFSEDHIGGVEHKDMEEYLQCKAMLFRMCKVGLINIDDESYEGIIKDCTCEIKTYGFGEKAEIRAENYKLVSNGDFLGMSFDVCDELNFSAEVSVPGKFNAYNALSAIACANALGISVSAMKEGLSKVKVKGRMEPIKVKGNYTLLIESAHNAMSMENMLKTLRQYNPKRIVCMFGAGGNRPKIRRYEMGEVCGNLADLSVITEDNSRFEDVNDIIADIRIGMDKTSGKFVEIPNRIDAIRYCLENAQEGDIIVLAGKGSEDYQETKGEKTFMDERVIVADILSDLER